MILLAFALALTSLPRIDTGYTFTLLATIVKYFQLVADGVTRDIAIQNLEYHRMGIGIQTFLAPQITIIIQENASTRK